MPPRSGRRRQPGLEAFASASEGEEHRIFWLHDPDCGQRQSHPRRPVVSTATRHIDIHTSTALIPKQTYCFQTHAFNAMPPLPQQYFLGASMELASQDHVTIHRGHTVCIEPYDPILESVILLLISILIVWSVVSSAYTTIHLVDWLWEYARFPLETFCFFPPERPSELHSDPRLEEHEAGNSLREKRKRVQHDWTIVEGKGCWGGIDQWVPVPLVDGAVAMKEQYDRLRQRAKTI